MASESGRTGEGLYEALAALVEAFASRRIVYALIGGLATSLRGRFRLTQDVDILLDVPQVTLPRLLSDLQNRGFSIDQPKVIREFLRESITSFHWRSIRIDWLRPVLPLYRRALDEARVLALSSGGHVRVATAEGLILTKLVAFRAQDQADIETLLAANQDRIDAGLIRTEWSPFVESEPERTQWLFSALGRHGHPG